MSSHILQARARKRFLDGSTTNEVSCLVYIVLNLLVQFKSSDTHTAELAAPYVLMHSTLIVGCLQLYKIKWSTNKLLVPLGCKYLTFLTLNKIMFISSFSKPQFLLKDSLTLCNCTCLMLKSLSFFLLSFYSIMWMDLTTSTHISQRTARSWIEANFQKRECIKFVPSPRNEDM